jgi:hypothetical protein
LTTSAGCQRVDDEGRDIVRPRHDVDFLALQFADNRLNAGAAHTDAGTDRVDASCRGK